MSRAGVQNNDNSRCTTGEPSNGENNYRQRQAEVDNDHDNDKRLQHKTHINTLNMTIRGTEKLAALARTSILLPISWLISFISSSCLRNAPTVACLAQASFSSNLSVISSSRLFAICSSTCLSISSSHTR